MKLSYLDRRMIEIMTCMLDEGISRQVSYDAAKEYANAYNRGFKPKAKPKEILSHWQSRARKAGR